jgi:hypothetical protein
MNYSSKPDPKNINDVLNSGSLSIILRKAKLLEQFNIALTRHLPTAISMHCQAMNVKNSILVIGVDNATWLTRLRFEEDTLLNSLQSDPNVPNVLGLVFKILY